MKRAIFIVLCIFSTSLFGKDIAKFSITFNADRIDAPIAFSLDGIDYNTDEGSIALYDVTSKKAVLIPCMLKTSISERQWFDLNGIIKKGSIKIYALRQENKKLASKKSIHLHKDNEDLELNRNGQAILKYRYIETPAPKEADPLYKRSGYIHPLYSPGGEILTCIQPKDHYHHYGIWGPWTKTHIEGREVDFWNLKKGQGTVQFSGFLSETEGAVFGGFQSLQQHIDFGAKGADAIAMNEILDVRAWNVSGKIQIIDYTTSLNCSLDSGIMLDAYRYGGGIGYRANQKWHKNNCTVLTSEGKTRIDADGSNARWCIVEGESDTEEGRSGVLFLSHPSNRMHPEPMRVWPLNANGDRGDLYFEFVPIRHQSWKLNKNQTYTLKYRMVVFDGKMNADLAEKYWIAFASQPSILVQ